jgi:hypothetical protein
VVDVAAAKVVAIQVLSQIIPVAVAVPAQHPATAAAVGMPAAWVVAAMGGKDAEMAVDLPRT